MQAQLLRWGPVGILGLWPPVCRSLIGWRARRADVIVGLSSMSVAGVRDRVEVTLVGRKLIVVFYADMVGYSRLIGIDDVGSPIWLSGSASGSTSAM